ncbi:phage holin family protein [Streptomyces reniochalinae]|uniref:Phage holin family protein n=1 Tax=Streptomyces reniochalinae TaxID=2250578 RepID=A0A367EJ82_9ACTN|nr:phage holin family protein [Streptomyces reniochalinae]RCG18111.1 phage holin family protein [Streptomyces reniochalinae]
MSTTLKPPADQDLRQDARQDVRQEAPQDAAQDVRQDGHRKRTSEESVGELVKQASAQISELARQEMHLAQAEMQQKGKRFGLGGGMFGGAALFGFVALLAGTATGIVALNLVWPLWLAALVVTGALLVLAGVLALVGKQQIGKATPATPERAVESMKADVTEIKERSHR